MGDGGAIYIKGSRGVLRKRIKTKCAFIKSRHRKYSVAAMCRVLVIERNGFYAWLRQPESKRAIEYKRLLYQINQFWIESGFADDYCNITNDMKVAEETRGHNQVHRIMKVADIRSQRGYKCYPGFKGGKTSHVARTSLSGN